MELDAWRGERFRVRYLPLIRAFSGGRSAAAVTGRRPPDRHRLVRQKDELDKYPDIASIAKLVDATVSSEDVVESKPEPDVFEAVLTKLDMKGRGAVGIGGSPYDAGAAGKVGVRTIGVLCGGSWRTC
ncbi:HAD family hydrolase [Bradyrhizobium sp. Pa8]|uniref:HAD family hydrolase n=1 Tax=Bradyrhizobium sp. Pa8 TaxID=3386552 RepID=UPI00403F1316